MNNKERERLKVMARLQEKTLSQKTAATLLHISVRQVKRLYKNYLLEGDKGLISRRRGKIGNHSLPISVKDKAVELIKTHYCDFGPTFAHEKLLELHGLKISISTVRTLMIEANIWRPRNRKAEKVYQLRSRKDCVGELVQMDGSYHDWFEGRLPKCCLLVLVDDATSRLLGLKFVEWESSWNYFSFLKEYLKTTGRPIGLYTDRHAIFETTRSTEKDYKNTQFHRAMTELGIELILARSPQAKGRVERANGTLQDRLVKEMRLANITSLKEADSFLPSFIEEYNRKFGKIPHSTIDMHKALENEYDLERILCLHHERKITKDLMVYYDGHRYQIKEPNCKFRLGGKTITVLEKEDNSIELFYENNLLNFIDFDKEQINLIKNISEEELLGNWNETRGGKPQKDHPWKRWEPNSGLKQLTG